MTILLLAVACGKNEQNNIAPNNTANNTTPNNVLPNSDAPITYHRDIAPLLQESCVGCHRAGAIGPFELDTDEGVSALGVLVKHVTETGQMPPYKIDNSGTCGSASSTFDQMPSVRQVDVDNGATQAVVAHV